MKKSCVLVSFDWVMTAFNFQLQNRVCGGLPQVCGRRKSQRHWLRPDPRTLFLNTWSLSVIIAVVIMSYNTKLSRCLIRIWMISHLAFENFCSMLECWRFFCQAYKLYFRVNNHVSKGVHFNLKRLEVGLIHKGIVKNFQLQSNRVSW